MMNVTTNEVLREGRRREPFVAQRRQRDQPAVPQRDRDTDPGAPVGWEYHTVAIRQRSRPLHPDEIDSVELQRQLNELGRVGWELVHVCSDEQIRLEEGRHLMIFKREVPVGAADESTLPLEPVPVIEGSPWAF
jgi:hypothetical protein